MGYGYGGYARIFVRAQAVSNPGPPDDILVNEVTTLLSAQIAA